MICLALGLALFALFWFIWYPAPTFVAIGAHQIFLLVVGIDIIIGPLLTFIVFKSGKKTLKFDLTVIALLQVCALVYGVYTLLQARPAYIAALGGQFQVVQATEIEDSDYAKAKTAPPWFGPKLVGTKAPTDQDDIDALSTLAMAGGGPGHMPQLHIDYALMRDEIIKNAQPIADLKKANPSQGSEIDNWLISKGSSADSAKFQSIRVNASFFAIVLDAKTARIIGIAPFNPAHPSSK